MSHSKKRKKTNYYSWLKQMSHDSNNPCFKIDAFALAEFGINAWRKRVNRYTLRSNRSYIQVHHSTSFQKDQRSWTNCVSKHIHRYQTVTLVQHMHIWLYLLMSIICNKWKTKWKINIKKKIKKGKRKLHEVKHEKESHVYVSVLKTSLSNVNW